jgi:hypothetical protein
MERRRIVGARREVVAKQLAVGVEDDPLLHVASDHLLSLVDTELAWLDRSITYLRDVGWANAPEIPMQHTFEKEISQENESP